MAVFPVVLDANVIYGIFPTDLLITTAGLGLYRAHWTEEILNEAHRNILNKRPDLDPASVDRRFEAMRRSMTSAMIGPPATELINAMTNDPGDRHVLAAAISINAEVIVTNNSRHFPIEACQPHGVEAQTLDEFVTGLVSLDARKVTAAIVEMATRRTRPPVTPEQICSQLEKHMPTAIAELRASNL